MNVAQLHIITSKLLAGGHGQMEVAINIATFAENENGTILTVKAAKKRRVQGADDSGPVGPKEPFLVITGDHKD